jgi:RNA polymerase sigma-70 factor (ECF subfamily)
LTEDRGLVQQARAGDADAFGELFNRHACVVRADLFGRVPPAETEDLVQEAFLLAWKELRALRRPEKFGPWVRRIARNLAVGRRRGPSAGAAVEPAAPEGPDIERNRAVRAALASLPEHYRVPIWLRYAQGLSGPEVASRLGVSHGSLRVVLHRGTKLLREKLRRVLGEEGADG